MNFMAFLRVSAMHCIDKDEQWHRWTIVLLAKLTRLIMVGHIGSLCSWCVPDRFEFFGEVGVSLYLGETFEDGGND